MVEHKKMLALLESLWSLVSDLVAFFLLNKILFLIVQAVHPNLLLMVDVVLLYSLCAFKTMSTPVH